MQEWKKSLIICEYCEHADEPCEDIQMETETNPRRKSQSWKCKGYERDENK